MTHSQTQHTILSLLAHTRRSWSLARLAKRLATPRNYTRSAAAKKALLHLSEHGYIAPDETESAWGLTVEGYALAERLFELGREDEADV